MKNSIAVILRSWTMLTLLLCSSTASAQLQKLKIADNNRFLVKEDGSPFVWIGETNWFFAQLPPTTIDSILDKRSAQGFTVMFVSCRNPLYNGGGPGKIDNPNEDWWAYLDEYIEKCAARGMYVGITLGWWSVIKNNTETDLYDFGKWVGNRYRNHNNIVWLTLGETGSHKRKTMLPEAKVHALVKGIRAGDTGNKLLTIHADFKRGTSISADGAISDFNNWQTSQWCCIDDLPRKDERTWTVWEAMQFDYNQRYDGKPKPTLDSEAWYENNKDFCDASSFNIRRRAYFTIFAGGFGHTYGAGGIWDGLRKQEGCSGTALEAINYPGAQAMSYLSYFLHGLGDNFLKLRPNQSLIAAGNSDNYDTHIQATIAVDKSFALIYSASDSAYSVDLSKLADRSLSAIWYNPRTNYYQPGQAVKWKKRSSVQVFDPPGASGAGNDWVLLIGNRKTLADFQTN